MEGSEEKRGKDPSEDRIEKRTNNKKKSEENETCLSFARASRA
jgi:hypothetical protein